MSNTLSNPEEFEEEERGVFDCCPNCNRQYDEIDFEYQICHYCKYDASVDLKDTDGSD